MTNTPETPPVAWHLLSVAETARRLDTDPAKGLTPEEAPGRLQRYGPNELQGSTGRSPLAILLDQARATMVLVLLAAAGLAGALGDVKNTVAIGAIVVLFVLLGTFQEHKAEKAIAALKRLAVPEVTVLRAGVAGSIPTRQLVPGDVVLLEAGDLVPADVRLAEAAGLRVQEAALTGESEPITKQTGPLDVAGLPLGDRRNLAFMGTVVTQGRGTALVVATGMGTELGKIAGLLQQTGEGLTPLQRRLDRVGKYLALAGFGVAVLVFLLGLWRGDDVRHLLLTAVSVAVAIIPEGLPAVVTITLALGAQRMLARSALIRRLPAVETLGSVTIICSDKTGTLTENRMTVVVLDVAGHELDLTEDVGRDGSVQARRNPGSPAVSALSLAAVGGALCNDARLVEGEGGSHHTIGDPTEGALVAAAAAMGYWKTALDESLPRQAELPFDSDRKRMTTVHRLGGHDPALLPGLEPDGHQSVAFTKGSAEGLLTLSSRIWVEGAAEPIDDAWRVRIAAAEERLARRGMRVLGVAFRLLSAAPTVPDESLETDLTFVGLFGMIDPPRAEVADAVATCRAAGIQPAMITGDHPLTALEIARRLGIAAGDHALTGTDLERLSVEELRRAVADTRVFARVSPEHKLRIVEALQHEGHVVAMTGDGVNDAPALRRADIGVAMGITGTDVAKEAADMVLLDDNFATIVSAVSEGRTVYANIRKFVRFSVAGNIGKVLVMLLAPFLGTAVPLLPLQLLWLNLLTDGLLGLGLGLEPPEPAVMQRPPQPPAEGIFPRPAALQVVLIGLLIGGLALSLGTWAFHTDRSTWQTLVFTSLAFAQVAEALALRSRTGPRPTGGLSGLRLVTAMAVLVVALQLAVVYTPGLNGFFGIRALGPMDLALAAAAGAVVFAVLRAVQSARR
jgi:Ca2+-transporting ATPase